MRAVLGGARLLPLTAASDQGEDGEARSVGGRVRSGAVRWRLVLLTAALVTAADQATKWWAVRSLVDRDIELVGSLQLNLVHNTGASFGFGSRYAPLIALLAAVVVVLLLRTSAALVGTWPRFGVGLVLGGAVGNLLDRVLRDGGGFLGGAVIDFVDLQWWPVFNLADAAITVGAVLLALTASREAPASDEG